MLGLVGLGLMPVESFLEVEDFCPEVVGLDLMPEESFLEGEDLCAEVAPLATERSQVNLRSEAFLLSENETMFFNGEQGFTTTPRVAAAMADLKDSASRVELCREKLAVSDGESAQDYRTWFSDSEMANESSSTLRSM